MGERLGKMAACKTAKARKNLTRSLLFSNEMGGNGKGSEKKNLKFTEYFVKHKEEELRDKMSKYTREHAGMTGGLDLNPIEWLHYMSKIEIDKNG